MLRQTLENQILLVRKFLLTLCEPVDFLSAEQQILHLFVHLICGTPRASASAAFIPATADGSTAFLNLPEGAAAADDDPTLFSSTAATAASAASFSEYSKYMNPSGSMSKKLW